MLRANLIEARYENTKAIHYLRIDSAVVSVCRCIDRAESIGRGQLELGFFHAAESQDCRRRGARDFSRTANDRHFISFYKTREKAYALLADCDIDRPSSNAHNKDQLRSVKGPKRT